MAKASIKAPKGIKTNTDNKVEVTVPQSEQQTAEQDNVAVATDNVPDGEPKENEDGSITVYDENNEPVGTATAEEVREAEEAVTGVEIDTTSPLEQLKSEDAPKVEVSEPTVSDTGVKPKENVKIRLRVDHSCCIAMERYDFKAGRTYNVPKNVKRILNRAGVLSPL